MSKVFVTTALSLMCLMLCQCKAQPEAGKAAAKVGPQTGPSMAFEIDLSLTPAAKASLLAADDHIAVDGSYYGYPTEAAMGKANRLHQIELGDEKISIAAEPARVRISGDTVDRSLLTDIRGPANVLVRVYSLAKVGNQSDRLTCTYYRDSLERAQAAPVPIRCDVVKP